MPQEYLVIVGKLLTSKTRSVQVLGWLIGLVIIMPATFEAFGVPDLKWYERAGRISQAALQSLLVVGSGAIAPRVLLEDSDGDGTPDLLDQPEQKSDSENQGS